MKLAYIPVDIPCKLPDEATVVDWFHNHKLIGEDYWEVQQKRHTWCMISTSHEPSDWRKYDSEMWEKRRVEQDRPDLFFHPGFEETFPEIANVIRQLPFKQLTVSGMLYQMNEIPNHQDTFDPHNPTEPRRYTIYLTDPKYNTFYMTKNEHDEDKHYIEIDNDYCCFLFNNTDHWHGASKNNRPKIILTTAGILDNEKHDLLLKRSIEKFGHKALYL